LNRGKRDTLRILKFLVDQLIVTFFGEDFTAFYRVSNPLNIDVINRNLKI
jgi:hypothetical protein